MKKLTTGLILIISWYTVMSQWSGDGYLMESPGHAEIWGSYETIPDHGYFGGVYYRVIVSNITVIHAMPRTRNGNQLILDWTQYRANQNTWVPEWRGEMVVNETLLPVGTITAKINPFMSPSRQQFAGWYAGQVRTLFKYIGGREHPYQTDWSPMGWTINVGAESTQANNLFVGMMDGYVISTNGNPDGDYIMYQETPGGGWRCLNGLVMYLYHSGGANLTIICLQEFDLSTARISGYYNKYRTNYANLNRQQGIFRPNEWILESSGDINFIRNVNRCPDNTPTATLTGTPIVGCIHADAIEKFKYTNNNPIEVRGIWTRRLFTVTAGPTAPGPVGNADCDAYCNNWCISNDKSGGRYNGSTGCVQGWVWYESKGCDCNN